MKRATLSTKHEVHICRSATITRSRALGELSVPREENVRAKQTDFYILIREGIRFVQNVTPSPHFCRMSTFWNTLNPKKWFSRICLSVCQKKIFFFWKKMFFIVGKNLREINIR